MAKPSIAKRNRTSPTDPDAKLYLKIRRCGPAITKARADEIEQTEQNPESHMWRRAALGFLCMPCEELFGKIETDRKTAVIVAEAAHGIRDYTKGLRALANCLEGAQVRIEVGLCKRDDYYDVLAEAKVEQKASKRLYPLAGAHHG